MGFLNFLESAPSGVTGTVRADPYSPHWISGSSFKLHSMMGTALFMAACVVFFKEAVGDHIHCIQDSSDGDRVSYSTSRYIPVLGVLLQYVPTPFKYS